MFAGMFVCATIMGVGLVGLIGEIAGGGLRLRRIAEPEFITAIGIRSLAPAGFTETANDNNYHASAGAA